MLRTSVIPLSLLFLLLSAYGQSSGCGYLLSKGKAGPISSGMTVDELYAKVGRTNTKLVDLQLEGFFSPAIELYLNPNQRTKPSLVAEITGQYSTFRIDRVTINDPRFKTVNGIGIGSTLGEIRHNYKVDWIGFCEGPLCARVEQLGMTFALDFAHPPRKWYKTNNPALIPNSAKVVWILVASGATPVSPH